MGYAPTIENKKVRHEYYVEESIECGIELRGNEVKSIRESKASIKESWVSIENGEAFIKGMHITMWKTSNTFDTDEKRDKKLLLHKREIIKLGTMVKQSGYTLMVLKVYFNEQGRCKAIIGLCRGKHSYDKRQCDKEKSMRREIDNHLKNINK